MPSQHFRRATRVPVRPAARSSVLLGLTILLALLVVGCTGGDDSSAASGSSLPLAREFQADPSSTAPTTTTPPTTTTTSPFALPSADPNIEGLTQELLTSPAGGVPLSPTEARCVASGMLTKLGMDPLVRLGAQATAGAAQVDLNALNPGERQAFADALIGCIDLNQLIVDQLGPALGLPQESLGCVATRLADDGTLTNVLRQVVVGGTDSAGADAALTSPMLAALDNCLTADQLRKLTVPR